MWTQTRRTPREDEGSTLQANKHQWSPGNHQQRRERPGTDGPAQPSEVAHLADILIQSSLRTGRWCISVVKAPPTTHFVVLCDGNRRKRIPSLSSKAEWRSLPWGSRGYDSMLRMQGAQVQSLVRELDPTCCNYRSCILQLRVYTLQRRLKVLRAATKTWCSQNK